MISTAFLLFLIMDSFGSMVVVNSLLSECTPRQKKLVVLREGVIAAALLVLAAFFGGAFIAILGLKEYSLQLAGGIVLFLIALGMLFPSSRLMDEPTSESPLIVPIAMPLIAGPSALSIVILLSEREPITMVVGAIVLAAAATTAVLALSTELFSFLGRRGSIALERLMGILLITLSVQMILDGINAFIASLG